MIDDDADLAQRSLAGDEQAMRSLVERYQGPVFGLSYRMVGNREDAEDVVQDVFLRVFRSLHRWDPLRPMKPWVLMIAANRCRTVLQRRSRQALPTEHVAHIAIDEGRTGAEDLAEELQLAIEKLRDEYRVCFVLFYQQELSCSEIGEIMDCPLGTVKTWLHRARRELAEHLQRRGVVPDAQFELHKI